MVFVSTERHFRRVFPRTLAKLPADGALWVAWPKKSSSLHIDLTEDTIREVALLAGLVDNKVCAVDPDWSGLRLVYAGRTARHGSLSRYRTTRRPVGSAPGVQRLGELR